MAHKAIHHHSPNYIASLLKLKLPNSSATRSTNTFLLHLPPKHNLHSTNNRLGNIRRIILEHSPYIHPYYTINSKLQETNENQFI